MIGQLRVRQEDPRFDLVADPRRRAGRWALGICLRAVAIAMIVGARSFKGLEALTEEMSSASRRALGLPRRLPDTTARDLIVRLSPWELMKALYRQVRAAYRRGAIEPTLLPWGVLSMDGKDTVINAWDDEYAQRQGARGHLRTITGTLVSSDARICIGAIPIPPSTNEVGHYKAALGELVAAYRGLDLFRVVMYDAGGCSESNARWTRTQKLHYVMVLNAAQPTLFAEATTVLGAQDDSKAACMVTDKRVRYTLWSTTKLAGFLDWTHLTVVVRLRREELGNDGAVLRFGERYFVSSLRHDALDAKRWVTLLRSRWGVENNSHHLWDSVFGEDDSTWVSTDPVGALNVLLLRRIASNLLVLFRARTLRTDSSRLIPWRDLLRKAYNALISATEAAVAGLRPRPPCPCPVP